MRIFSIPRRKGQEALAWSRNKRSSGPFLSGPTFQDRRNDLQLTAAVRHRSAGAGSRGPGRPHSIDASNSSLRVLRQVGAGSGFGLRDEGRGVLLHQAVQPGLLGTVTLILDRRAIGRPAGLLHRFTASPLYRFTASPLHRGLHALF